MRSVIISRIEEVDRISDEVTVYRLTNGLSWAGLEEVPGMEVTAFRRTTLYHDGGKFFLFIEGSPSLVEVTLLACRRRIWSEVPRSEPMVGAH